MVGGGFVSVVARAPGWQWASVPSSSVKLRSVLGAVRCVPTPWSPAAEPAQETVWRTTATTATFREAVLENEEVVPVNAVSTWVLPSGVTVGR